MPWRPERRGDERSGGVGNTRLLRYLTRSLTAVPAFGGSLLSVSRILVIDNYDSFVYNLVQYLGQLGVEAVVWRNDDPRLTPPFDAEHLREAVAGFDGVLLSPGPGTPPQRAGATMPMVEVAAAEELPPCWVCAWGHQAIGAAFGGTVDRAPRNCCTERPRWSSTTTRVCSPACRIRSPPPATTR